MVVLDVKLDNILVFNDFSLNLSYSKKPVNSVIADEYLAGRPNFRYKKLIVLMGANATGKTALGNALRSIFNFISRREYAVISDLIENPRKVASFSIDLAFSDYQLFRINATFNPRNSSQEEYKSSDIQVNVKSEKILKTDSYERCAARLSEKETIRFDSYIQALESVPYLTWKFELPIFISGKQRAVNPVAPDLYVRVLEKTLQALDPRIENIEKIKDTDNTFIIRYKTHSVLIKDGVVMEVEKLSSGTVEGIGIADLITAMKCRAMDFLFCDEKFSHVHAASEKAFLSLLIELIGANQQLIFTTHNSDVLDMNLPLHSYAFLRRDEFDENSVTCVFASEYIKKNTQSLKNAVENDLFLALPDTDRIFKISDLFKGAEI